MYCIMTWINKKKTPTGDENIDASQYTSILRINKKKTPTGDEKRIKVIHKTIKRSIDKKKTPTGDENSAFSMSSVARGTIN